MGCTLDIAAAAGVSATLVSWVAKGTATQHRISEATQRRVRVAMEQLGYRPAGPEVASSSTTQQPNNLTTLLAAAGYRLVPVENGEELSRMPREGLVGLVYRELRVASHESRVGEGESHSELRVGGRDAPLLAGTVLPAVSQVEPPAVSQVEPPAVSHDEPVAPVNEVVLTEPFDQAQGRPNPPLSETQEVVSAVEMEGAALSAPVSREAVEVTTPVSEARNPVSEVVPQPVESPAPPVEPVAAPTPTTPEAILEVAPIPASTPPVVLTEPFDQAQGRQNPPLSETPPSVSEVAADVPAAEVADDDPPGTNAAGPSTSLRAGTSASTLVAEPVAEPEIESPAPPPETSMPTAPQA